MKRKNIEHVAKIIMRNHIFFRKKLFSDANFKDKIETLIMRHFSNTETKSIIYLIVFGKEYRENNFSSLLESASVKCIKKELITFNNWDKGRRTELRSVVSDFMQEFNLGKEWKDTLIILCTTGKFRPPNKNFHIGCDIKDKKRVVITLNPDTSLDDLANEWGIIKKFQETLYPDFKKTNVTENSIRNFERFIEVEMLRIVEADKVNRSKISHYDERMYNPTDLKKSQEVINKIRAQRRETGADRKAKPVRFTSRVSYKNVNKIRKGDNKSYNNLNQQRRRLKN